MIDNAAILFSTIAVLVTIYRAVRLDAAEPWFKPSRGAERERGGRPAAPPWRRR